MKGALVAVDLVRTPKNARARAQISPTGWPWQAQLLLLGAIWGSSFLFIKVGDRSFAPFDIAGGRIALAAVTLLAVLFSRPGVTCRGAVPAGRTWRWRDSS